MVGPVWGFSDSNGLELRLRRVALYQCSTSENTDGFKSFWTLTMKVWVLSMMSVSAEVARIERKTL